MIDDSLGSRVRGALESVPAPSFPATALAERIAAAQARGTRPQRRPATAIVGGTLLLAAALAVGVPTVIKLSPGYVRTMKRLTGQDWSHARTIETPFMSLAEARRHTTFPIVVPVGKRVIDAHPLDHDAGIVLVVAVDVHGQASLTERRVSAPPSALEKKMQGIGVHDDGSIRRFNVRRWRIGQIDFSVPMFTLEYHRYAEELERATRAAVAEQR
jgi:hypothetical protein